MGPLYKFSRGTGYVLSLLGISGVTLAQSLYGPTIPGEGVYAVARKFDSPQDEFNLKQWALSIYALNPSAFNGHMDRLKAGIDLKIPSLEEVDALWPIGKNMVEGGPLALPSPKIEVVTAAASAVNETLQRKQSELPNRETSETSVMDLRERPPEVEPSPQSSPIVRTDQSRSPSVQTFGPVGQTESIYAIAGKLRNPQVDLSLHKWAWAIYAINPDAFSGDLGSLKSGAMLFIPTEHQVRDLWAAGRGLSRNDMSRSQAAREIDRVVAAIRSASSAPMTAVGPVAEDAAKVANASVSQGLTERPSGREAHKPQSTSRAEQLSEASPERRIFGPVAQGQGIYSIAALFRDQTKASELNLRQWALALLAANPEAFDRAQLGGLRSGVSLKVPTIQEAGKLWAIGRKLESGESLEAWENAIHQILSDPSVELVDGLQSSPAMPAGDGSDSWSEKVIEPPELPTAESIDEPQSLVFRETELFERARAEAGGVNVLKVLDELRSAEDRFSGDVDFDYIFGVILLDGGEPQEALYPLLRAAHQRPDNLGIRLDLGRAYFESGENESARRIFESLAERSPPPQTNLVIDSYLQAIERRASRYEERLAVQLTLQGGYDTNANSATTLRSFGIFELDRDARETASPYVTAGAAVDYAEPINPRLSWQAGGRIQSRNYARATQFNSAQADFTAGLSFRRGNWSVFSALNVGQTYVDGAVNQEFVALTSNVQGVMDTVWAYRAGLKFGALRFGEALEIRDTDQWLFSAGGGRRLNFGFGTELSVDVAGGRDAATDSSSPFGRDLLGLSLGSSTQWLPSVRTNFAIHFLQADYDGIFVGVDREDKQLFTDLLVQYSHNRWKNWTVQLLAKYISNDSSVALYDYDRVDLGLGLRWVMD